MKTQIHFLNTGHSDCIILESNGHFAMIDAAEDTDYPKDMPHLNCQGYEDVVTEYVLKHCRDKNGKVTFDFILGTHCHSDHIGGFDTIILHPDITIKKAYLKPYRDDNVFIFEAKRWDNQTVYNQMHDALLCKHIPIIEDFENVIEQLGEFKITFFNGKYQKQNSIKFGENVHSVVTKVSAFGKTALLMGDLNYKNGQEQKITKQMEHVDLLKVGHHGYFGSTSTRFVMKTRPDIAVITNTMKRVSPDVKWKLKHLAHAKIYATADCNGVKIRFPENSALVVQEDITESPIHISE